MGLGGGIQGQNSRRFNYLNVLKIAISGLLYTRQVTQNKQIAASIDTMKDCQLEEKFCYLRNKLLYSNKNSKIYFYTSL